MPGVSALLHRLELKRLERAVRRAPRPTAPREIVELAFAVRAGEATIAPIQVRSELEALLELVQEVGGRTIVEIGSEFGGTLFALTRAAAPDACIVSVDLPVPDGYPREREPVYQAFAGDRQRLHLVRGDSHDPATRDRVAEIIGGQADLVFIDGDHAYEGVLADWELYRPLARPGGIVAFHDIIPGSDEDVGGVPRLWSELRGSVETEEIVADPRQGGYGIGIVRV
jgi:cephalosporin hydroxylase